MEICRSKEVNPNLLPMLAVQIDYIVHQSTLTLVVVAPSFFSFSEPRAIPLPLRLVPLVDLVDHSFGLHRHCVHFLMVNLHLLHHMGFPVLPVHILYRLKHREWKLTSLECLLAILIFFHTGYQTRPHRLWRHCPYLCFSETEKLPPH